MKKLMVALMAGFIMAGTAASAFAHDPGRQGHQGWKKVKGIDKHYRQEQVVQYRHWDPDRHAYVYYQPAVMHPPVREAHRVVRVPAPPIPVPGIHFLFPDVQIHIR